MTRRRGFQARARHIARNVSRYQTTDIRQHVATLINAQLNRIPIHEHSQNIDQDEELALALQMTEDYN